jgi:prepilin-type N-terminal cleavage/methylation domain-containing protein
MKIKQLAFTLIELLVVIAVIGILSGLIVVSMSGTTQKATIAKAQVFSNSLRNSLMMDLIAEYKLDGNANDSWGSHTAGTIVTASIYDSCVQNNCYNFSTAGSYIELSDASDLRMTTGGTISVWIYPKSTGNGGAKIVHKGTTVYGANGYTFRMDDTNRVIFSCNAGSYVYSNNVITFNQWSLVTITFNNSGRKIYINGVNQTYSGGNLTDLPPDVAGIVRIGNITTAETGYNFNGYIDEIRFYDQILTSYQNKEQYYSGLNNLLINGGINQEEYLSRINQIVSISN